MLRFSLLARAGAIALRLSGLLGGAIALAGAFPNAASAGVDTPSLTPPAAASVSAGEYYPLLLQWTQQVKLGSVGAQVVYLDPRLLIAQAKNGAGSAKQQLAAARRAVAGFPRIVKAEVIYTSPGRADLAPNVWHVLLRPDSGAPAPSTSATIESPPTLGSNASGTGWQETVIYTFENSGGRLLPPHTKFLKATLSGAPGRGAVMWPFVASAVPKPPDPTAYVGVVKWALIAICLLLVAAFVVTRPPREASA